MGKLKGSKVNIPQVRLQDYFWVVGGIPKSGKTTLAAKLAEEYFGDLEKVHLFGFEQGFKALRIKASTVDDWDDFEEQVDELIEEKDELGIEFVVMDTADRMHDMAVAKVIAEWNINNPQKKAKDINGVGQKKAGAGGYGVGYQLVKQKIIDQLDKISKAGYGIMVLTHSKDKKIEQKDGLEYDQLALSLSASAGEIFVNMADFIVFITIEKVKTKEGVVDKRYMHFRSDGYVSAGSRFSKIVDKVEYDVKEFITAFEDAVKAEFAEGFNIEQLRQEQTEKREKAAQEFVESYKEEAKESSSELSAEEIHEQLNISIKALDSSQRTKVTKGLKEILGGTANYTKTDDIDLLQKCLDLVAEIAE
jgi:hypothetical protein